MESELDDQTKLKNMISDIKKWHDEYDQSGEIWYNEVTDKQQEYPYIDQENTLDELTKLNKNNLDLTSAFYDLYKDVLFNNNNNND